MLKLREWAKNIQLLILLEQISRDANVLKITASNHLRLKNATTNFGVRKSI